MIIDTNIKSYVLDNFLLKSGKTLSLNLSYLTLGELNDKKDNVIVYPTRYAGTHMEQDYLNWKNLHQKIAYLAGK